MMVPPLIMGLIERMSRAFPPPAWMGPPAVVPGQVGEVLVLAHTDVAVVAVDGLAGYPTGFEFSLRLLLRRSKPFGRRVEPVDENPRRWRARPESAPPDFPRLSVQFADGTVISNLDRLLDDELEPARPQLVDAPQGIVGSQRTDLPYWVWRLPPPGLITFMCHWPACKIVDARAQIDASRILEAAGRSIDPWPCHA